ncbi:MAG: hypothetical protein Fur0018_11750 [Anaerolineales bacterium]
MSPPLTSSGMITYHTITISNAVFGSARLLEIGLPSGWNLEPGVSHPEVAATHQRGEQTWVVAGSAWYVVFHPENGWALEVAIHSRAAAASRPVPQAEAYIFNHPASLQWKTRRRGLPWNRHQVTFMNLTCTCPHTERRLNIEFSGWCPPEGFQAMLEAAHHWHCH